MVIRISRRCRDFECIISCTQIVDAKSSRICAIGFDVFDDFSLSVEKLHPDNGSKSFSGNSEATGVKPIKTVGVCGVSFTCEVDGEIVVVQIADRYIRHGTP